MLGDLVLVSVLLGVVGAQWGFAPLHRSSDCPPCDLSACRPLDCPAGQFYPGGQCACCAECALGVGARCYNASAPGLQRPPPHQTVVPCGENMECLLRKDLEPEDEREALCTCKQSEEVCGTDNITYENICHLMESSARGHGPQLAMKNWGPCESAPEITSEPEDTYQSLGMNLALECEAKGNPIPDLHWEFRSDQGYRKNLPSDDQSVSVQVRGGPDSYMVSSWVQILNMQVNYTGVYTCVATNPVGSVRAAAKVGVYKP